MFKMLPTVIWIEIISFLDLKTIFALGLVSKPFTKIVNRNEIWRHKIKQEFPELLTKSFEISNVRDFYFHLYKDKQLGYPMELIYLFAKVDTPICTLPIFDIGTRRGKTDYIDFIKYDELSHSIMRFTDIHNRPGIVFRLKGKSEIVLEHIDQRVFRDGNTLVLFSRYTLPSRWTHAWGYSRNELESALNEYHEKEGRCSCPDCPLQPKPNSVFYNLNISVIENLFNQNSPFVIV